MDDSFALELGPFLPSIEFTPQEFEQAVSKMYSAYTPVVELVQVEHRASLLGQGGDYEIDVLVRFQFAGLEMKILVECKHQKTSIKRDIVQVLHSRLHELGAHKGVIFSTSAFQRGALKYAESHGIALIQIQDGSSHYHVRSLDVKPHKPNWLPDIVGSMAHIKGENSMGSRVVFPGSRWFDSFLEGSHPAIEG